MYARQTPSRTEASHRDFVVAQGRSPPPAGTAEGRPRARGPPPSAPPARRRPGKPRRGVERKQPRLDLGEAHPAGWAGEVLRVEPLPLPHGLDDHQPLPVAEGRLHRVPDPGPLLLRHLDPIEDDLHVVALVFIELNLLVEGAEDPVHPHPDEPSRLRSSNRLLYSPLRPRITGAMIWTGVPSGRARIWSVICWAVWRSMGWPHWGQWGCPTRANRSRR